MNFSDVDKLTEVKREIRMRKRVYSNHGPMTDESRRRITIMEEIAADYEKKIAARSPELPI